MEWGAVWSSQLEVVQPTHLGPIPGTHLGLALDWGSLPDLLSSLPLQRLSHITTRPLVSLLQEVTAHADVDVIQLP